MAEELSYLRRRIDELLGEAERVKSFIALKGDQWSGRRRAMAELQHLEAAAAELEADVAALEEDAR